MNCSGEATLGVVKVNSIPSHHLPGHTFSSLGKWLFPDHDPQVMLPEMPHRRAQSALGATSRPHREQVAQAYGESQEGFPERFNDGQEGRARHTVQAGRPQGSMGPERGSREGSLWLDPRGPQSLWCQLPGQSSRQREPLRNGG